MVKDVLVILADGFEDVEAVTPIDILRRAGLNVVAAGVDNKIVKGARGVVVQADVLLSDVRTRSFEALVLPGGGPGAARLAASREVAGWVRKMDGEKKWIAAICASPAVVLAPLGILNGRKATCFPGLEKQFDSSTVFEAKNVVVDGHVVTSRALGTALEFSLVLVEKLVNPAMAQSIRQAVLAGV